MHVELDGSRLDTQPDSVAAALAAGVAAAEARGRIIIEAKGDGKLLDQETLAHPPQTPSDIAVLTLTSADPRTLASVTLHDAADAAQSIRDVQTEAAARLQSVGFDDEVLRAVKESLETWQAVRDVLVQVAAILQIDLNRIDIEGCEPGEPMRRTTELVRKLTELKAALGAEDWSGVADSLGYDLESEAADWSTMLRSMGNSIRGAGEEGGGA